VKQDRISFQHRQDQIKMVHRAHLYHLRGRAYYRLPRRPGPARRTERHLSLRRMMTTLRLALLAWWRHWFAHLPFLQQADLLALRGFPASSRRAATEGPATASGQQKADPASKQLEPLRKIIATVLEVPLSQVTTHTHFFLSGGDASALTHFCTAVLAQYAVVISPDDVFAHPRLEQLALVIAEKQATQGDRLVTRGKYMI
jgi:hypothetical protein